MRPSTYRANQRHFAKHWAPLADIPITEITQAMVAARLREIVRDYGRSAGQRARSVLSSLFASAMGDGLCDNNPVINTNDPLEGIDTSRERVLTDAELRRVWQAVDEGEFAKLIKLLILTGLRRDELGKLRWSEIDGNTITIHSERAKKHRTHFLTLPPMAMEILESIPHRPGRDHLFGKTSMTALRGRLGDMKHWQPHDLRTTFRTGLGKLSIPPLVAELAINHQKKGLIGVYDRHTYQAEIASALARWADHVAAVIEGRESNIVPLRA